MTKVVKEFGELTGTKHPHEHNCTTLEARPLCFLKCDCGYEGIAHVDRSTGKPICPADLARKDAAKREQTGQTNQIISGVGEESIQHIVAQAVAEALKQQAAQAKNGGN